MLKYFKRARETILPDENDCTLLSAKELKEVNKKVQLLDLFVDFLELQQCHNVEVSGSGGRCPTTTPLLSTATAYQSISLSPSLLHSSSFPRVGVHTFL